LMNAEKWVKLWHKIKGNTCKVGQYIVK